MKNIIKLNKVKRNSQNILEFLIIKRPNLKYFKKKDVFLMGFAKKIKKPVDPCKVFAMQYVWLYADIFYIN